MLRKLSSRVGSETNALYTDYESDRIGPYTYVLGARVGRNERVPRGMVAREIRSGDYAVYTDSGNPAVNVVLKLWQQVWSLEAQHAINRAYKKDFEVHHGVDENNDPGGRVDLYVGLKS